MQKKEKPVCLHHLYLRNLDAGKESVILIASQTVFELSQVLQNNVF